MSSCKQCADLKRAWGWAKGDVRDAARKCARRQTTAGIEAIKAAKERLARATQGLNDHQRHCAYETTEDVA